MIAQSRIKQITDELVKIESSVDVTQLRFGDLKLWPLVRRMHHFTRGAKDPKQPTSTEEIKNNAYSDLSLKWNGLEIDRVGIEDWQKSAIDGQVPVDVMFVSRLLDHTDVVDGLAYNRLFDPWLQLCRGKFNALKIEFNDPNKPPPEGRFEPTAGYTLPDWNDESLLDGIPQSVEGFDDVNKVFQRFSGSPINFSALTHHLPRIWSRRKTFKAILERIKPQAVCVICYYTTDIFALIWACKDLCIQTIDLQHGQQGPYHALYNHWTSIPHDGYQILPDFFFCWDERVRDLQIANSVNHSHTPRSLVVGNSWIDLWSQKDSFGFSTQLESFIDSLKDKLSVLVGLQPYETLFPDNIPSAMRLTPDWIWLLRVHPHQRHRIPLIKAFLDSAELNNYEIDVATHAPLYPLLKNVSHLVTAFSSIAWEAHKFGCPVTLTDPSGLDAYDQEITDGTFGYAIKAKTIVESISNRSRRTEGAVLEDSSAVNPAQILADVCNS
ncbi:MAG: hypothetical protein RIB43_06420 [Rhodospirillaceae bacterium]